MSTSVTGSFPMTRQVLAILAGYIIRACFSQERLVYIPVEDSDDFTAKVVYTFKDRKS